MEEKVWIYIISRELNSEELNLLNEYCIRFINEWTAHEMKLEASYEIFQNRLLIIKVNESSYNASGCSIDKLQRFVRELEVSMNVELLNRLYVAYDFNDKLKVIYADAIPELIAGGEMSEATLIYDNTISSSFEFASWKKPLKETWLKKYLAKINSK